MAPFPPKESYIAIDLTVESTDYDHPPCCPCCQLVQLERRDLARRASGTVGLAAGAVVGTTSALGGAEVGLAIGVAADPLGALAGALLGGLAGAAAGCATGARLGNVMDEQVLDSYRCLMCGHRFRPSSRPA